MIEITIKLDTDIIEDAVRKAWQREFNIPEVRYGERAGAGWNEVMRQVKLHISEMDFSDMIRRAAKARVDDVVNDAVTVALREKAKQRAKEMSRDGTLFDNNG